METRLLFAVMLLEQSADTSGLPWAVREAPDSVQHIFNNNFSTCGMNRLVCKQQPSYTCRTKNKRYSLDARYMNMKWNLIIAAVTCLVTGCSESVRREPIQPDDILSQEFRTIFRAQGHTNHLDFMHVTRTTRRGRIEYDVMARDLDQPELAGGPSLTITRNGTNWVVVAAGSWQP